MKMVDYFFAAHLDEGERIIYIAHRHPYILMKDSFKSFVLGIIMPLFFFYLFPQLMMIAMAWALGGLVVFFYHFFDWYFDAFLLTNAGVIDVESNGLFEKSSSRIEYHMIEGTAYTIKGFWATILGFGTLTVDKLGAQTSVQLLDAASPKKLEKKILHYQNRFVSEKSFRDHHALKDMLSDMIAYHIQNDKIKSPKEK